MTIQHVFRGIGRYGEHFMARTRREYFRVLRAGGGAGAITAGTVVFKFLIVVLKLSLMAQSCLLGLNYAGSFLLMQALGFRLATKQPSLLAVTLLRRHRSRPLQAQVGAITRSQTAATIGNFSLVVVAMAAYHVLYRIGAGHAFISTEEATHTLGSLDPFRSGTVPYAAFTGAILWMASLASGYLRQLARGTRLARHAAGLGFNVSLAFLLSAIPFAGKALGLPLDVRHFTLSSGALALSVFSLGPKAAWAAGLPAALLGIVLIGLLNFTVSFILSFVAAASAQGISPRHVYPEVRRALQGFARMPLAHLVPVGAERT